MNDGAGSEAGERQASVERFAGMHRARHFEGDRIAGIRTCASGAFLLTSTPLVEPDRRAFAAAEPTAAPIARIEENLKELTQREESR